VLILDDSTTWPDRFNKLLNQDEVINLFRSNRYMDQLEKNPILLPILEEIDSVIASVPLSAYHCTKQLTERPYSTTGLRILNFDQHHSEVLELLRNHENVSPSLFKKIDCRLLQWRKNHTGSREKMLWFCVDRNLVFDSGTESFFKYFGGEAIYFPFMDDPEIGPLLESIGEPVVVEVRIRSGDIRVYHQFAFARTLASHFANKVNAKFFIEGREGNLSKGVEAHDIIHVHPHKKFLEKFGPKRKL
jgi:hypothetical protein